MKLLLPSLLLSLLLPGSDQKQGKQGKCGNRMSNQGNKNPPHIILILADDLGWNEVRRFLGANENITTRSRGTTQASRHLAWKS